MKRSTPRPGPDDHAPSGLKEGTPCRVVAGTHRGKSGIVSELHVSKTGHTTLTVVQAGGVRFKTLARHVEVAGG